jgi:hypothetical protein
MSRLPIALVLAAAALCAVILPAPAAMAEMVDTLPREGFCDGTPLAQMTPGQMQTCAALALDRALARSPAAPDEDPAETARKAAIVHRDPSAINLCPPPRKMTEWNGCQ